MMTMTFLFYVLLRSPTAIRLTGRPTSSTSVTTRHLSNASCFRRSTTKAATGSPRIAISRTPRLSSAPQFSSCTKSVSSRHSYYCQNKPNGSLLPPIPQYKLALRRDFSQTSTTLLAAKSDHTSSSSSENLSPLARSIAQALGDLANGVLEPSPATRQRFLLILSVSGGCDSVALLHATMELQTNSVENLELDCRVVHFHHRQREKEADLDCQLVQELAQDKYGIPIVLQDWNDEEQEGNAGTLKFTQDRARQWRRRRLVEYTQTSLLDLEAMDNSSGKNTIGVILTAHHKDDSEESLMLKLLRGVHILNLSGMEAVTPIENNGNGKIFVLRPWLNHRKAGLQDYLLSNNHIWREDASNSSPKYLRNRVRNELIPLLEDLSPNIHKRLEILEQQSSELQQDLEPRILAHLDQQTVAADHGASAKQESQRRQYIWEKHEKLDASPLVESQALFRWMQEEIAKDDGAGPSSVSYETLQRVLKQLKNYPNQLDWSMDLGGNFCLQRKGDRLSIVHPSDSTSSEDSETTQRKWSWSIMASNENKDSDDAMTLSLPSEMVSSRLQFVETSLSEYARLPKASKRFCPPWRASPVKLGQFLRGQKVPLHERDATPVLYMTATTNEQHDSPSNHGQDDYLIVAVQVNGSWMVHADYCHRQEEKDSNSSTRLGLQVQES